jgi:D-glycero-alpha-D-manno-heptose-7-phosphate kinase
VTVNVAIDRRASCRVETHEGGLRLESKDTLVKLDAEDVGQALATGRLGLHARILHALGAHRGLRVVTHSRVPAGSGLGGSSALAVTIAAAVSEALGRPLAGEAIVPLVRDAEAQCIGVPTGVQDYLAAIHGGVNAVQLDAGGVRTARAAADPAWVEENLLLVDAGITRFSGLNNWAIFKARIDGEAGVTAGLGEIAAAAREMVGALAARGFAGVAAAMAREWGARRALGPGVTTPEIDRIAELASAHGGAAKVCGAGGGGLTVCWIAPERRTALLAALQAEGFKAPAFRVDLAGLAVDRRES